MMSFTLHTLLDEAGVSGASDIHLAVGKAPIVRKAGELMTLPYEALSNSDLEQLILPVLTEEQRTKLLHERDLDLSLQAKDGTRFRVNLHFEKNNLGLAGRIIPTVIPTLESIGMPEVVHKLTQLNYGLVLVTGPTGAGKSTSLASMINLISNERAVNIVTLEDPIEFILQSNKSIVRQRQLGTDMISFTEGLKHTLRQDPDVIMVGEMRDLDTISTTLTLAETGHLVLATLHTNNAAETIDRIIDVFPPYQQTQIRLQVSYTLKGVISQRLLPKVGGGRIAAREILVNNAAIANLIRENKLAQINTVLQTSAIDGMRTMDQDIKNLLQANVISRETALSHITTTELLNSGS